MIVKTTAKKKSATGVTGALFIVPAFVIIVDDSVKSETTQVYVTIIEISFKQGYLYTFCMSTCD